MIFKNWVMQNFPFLEDDFDALTDYELFCKMLEYVKEFAKDNEDFKKELNELETYIYNLPIQEEVDKKLDEMVESGQLQEIISEYLNAQTIFCFDNVEQLKEATNLIKGSYAETLGYYDKDDGGVSLYYITDTLDNTVHQETLEDGLYATLIIKNNILNLESIGCYGDGIHDDTVKLQYAITLASSNGYIINGNKNYLITDTIELPTVTGLNIYINNILTNIENKPVIYLNHTKRSKIEINNIIREEKIDVPILAGEYDHQTAFLLHGTLYDNIIVRSIRNLVCAFTFYSTSSSSSEGCYYNQVSCETSDTFIFTHLLNINGAINGNTFNESIHYLNTWTNPNNLTRYTIYNDGYSTTSSPVYQNNHNVFKSLMMEGGDADTSYTIANLENASNFHITVDRIEINPSIDTDNLVLYNTRSINNLTIFNTAWFNIPENKAQYGTNIITCYNNYDSSYLPVKYVNSRGFTINSQFEAVQNDVCDGHFTYYPRTKQLKINGIFKPTVNLNANENYTFGSLTFLPESHAINTGIVYLAGSGNPTAMTQIGTIRQIAGVSNYNCYLRVNQSVSNGTYLFINWIAG